ncbi:MAG TPA: threonine synthase, partial [Chitinophagaceae bacterium]
MKYYSLNGQSPLASFREAATRGQAPDKGLYFPERIPQFERKLLENIEKAGEREIAVSVIRPYVGDDIPGDMLEMIVAETLNFPIPLVRVNDRISSLELYHGPTLAFKDVGARFMSRCLGYFAKERSQKLVVLVATSGDTGGAVANGFYDVKGVDVVILYPSGKVSGVQEKQLTTLGRNIHPLEVAGDFDQCQALVKRAFADTGLNESLFLTSANSINVARWLPQQFYYLFAWKQWKDKSNPPVIAVPSGNFGNLCAGLLANASGMPAAHFIAACNANDVIPEFLLTGDYRPKRTVATISNAMDVGDPNNFVRILEIFGKDSTMMKRLLSATSITDDETRETIATIFRDTRYLLDPHGAVGYISLERWLDKHRQDAGYFVETAHPIKFYDVVEPVIGAAIDLPDAVKAIIDRPKSAVQIEPEFE